MTPQEALDRIKRLPIHGRPGAEYVEAEDVRAVLADVTPEPGGVLDRDQARAVLTDYLFRKGIESTLEVLAGCVRPGAGVTLTPEEAARTLLWWAIYREEGFPGITDAALVARLEATQ